MRAIGLILFATLTGCFNPSLTEGGFTPPPLATPSQCPPGEHRIWYKVGDADFADCQKD